MRCCRWCGNASLASSPVTHTRRHRGPRGAADQNDHDTLRYDPVCQWICDRTPRDGHEVHDFNSLTTVHPTHSRFENAIDIPSLFRLQDVLIDQFLASFDAPPARLALGIDPFETTCVRQRLFAVRSRSTKRQRIQWYQAGSWEQPRWKIIKVEAHAQGTNRWAVVTNRLGATSVPQGVDGEYVQRGESENRNKE